MAQGRLSYRDLAGRLSLIDNLATCITLKKILAKGPPWADMQPLWTIDFTARMSYLYEIEKGKACQQRRVCVTRTGKMGLVPARARVGDVILILLGGPLPLVARKTSKAHRLMGTAYIHGIMDGEALESADWRGEDIELD